MKEFRHKTVDYPSTSSALAGDEGASSLVGRRGKGGGRGRRGAQLSVEEYDYAV